MITADQELKMLIHELLKVKIEDKLVALLRKVYGMKEEEELDELSSGVLDRYRSKASSQLRRGTYGASANDSLRAKMRKRTNRIRGVKQADNRIEKHDDENEKPVSEGLGDAFGHLARHSAAQTIAKGLGVHPSLVHAFVAHLRDRRQQQKQKQQTTKTAAAPRPQPQPQPQQQPKPQTGDEPIRMDRKEFARKLKAVGNDIKKVK